jgi:predicted N-acetyltransferase YhbS
MIKQPNATVRRAHNGDVERITELIAHLGFVVSSEVVTANLISLKAQGFHPLVAETDEVIGCVSISLMHVLHRPTPVGRLSMLIVAPAWRGKGIGRALVEEALQLLREGGCDLCEVTSNLTLVEAHAFYERLGFQHTSVRLARSLGQL